MIVELTGMAPSGEAVGRLDGMVVFVSHALPGEQVEVEVFARRRHFLRGRAGRVLRAAPERVAPRCPHFGTCGGCQWQHAAYAAQARYKTGLVREQLERLGGIRQPPVGDCLACPDEYAYRNHSQFGVSGDGRLGYFRASSNDLVAIEACPILAEPLQETLALLRARGGPPAEGLKELHARAGDGQVMLVLEYDDARSLQAALTAARRWIQRVAPPAGLSISATGGGRAVRLAGPEALSVSVGPRSYRVSPASFFQVNTRMAAALVAQVMQALALSGGERVLDLYCGAGLFTLPISELAGRVVGVEADAGAAADARANLAGRDNAEIVASDVARALAGPLAGAAWDRVVIDPPRAGVERDALARVAELGAARLAYVSCEPATLARDARWLGDAGYRLARAQPLDLFPHTRHVETVALFTRV